MADPDVPALPPGESDVREAGPLARALGEAYRRIVASMEKQWQMAPADATAQLQQPPVDNLQETPGNEVTWWRLSRLAEQDPAAATAIWERVKAEARDELDTGYRAAEVMEWEGSPWRRAEFLALRAAFREEWQPRGGIEAALVDAMAQAYTAYQLWMMRSTITSYAHAKRQDALLREYGSWEPPRITEAETIDRMAAMADRWHKMFLRNVRALRDLRRYSPPNVVVQHAGQVNVGQQQVNVSRPKPATAEET